MPLFEDLVGSLLSYFRIGENRWTDNGGVFEARSGDGSTLINTRGARAAGIHDYVTLEDLTDIGVQSTLKASGLFWSPVDMAYGNATSSLTDFTVGKCFSIGPSQIGVKITGIKFYWVSKGASTTIRCTLWSAGGAVIKTVDKTSVNATNTYSALFGSSYTTLAADGNTTLMVSVYDLNVGAFGTAYTVWANPEIAGPVDLMRPTYPSGPGFLWTNEQGRFTGGPGELFPATPTNSELYLVEPIFG